MTAKSVCEFKPREKLAQLGIKNLSEVELIGLIIGSGDVSQSLPIIAKNTWALISKHPSNL
jgi:DNA repair protein RadC